MSKRLVILLSVFFVSLAVCAGAARRTPLRDGFGLAGVDGKLIDTDGKWFFELYSEVSDDRGRISAGSAIELLPSSTLEKMTEEVKGRSEASYRLWGNVTEYSGRNFIFPVYFLPITAADEQTETEGSEASQQKTRIPVNEPNDILTMPEEIVGKLKTRRVLRREQLKEGLELKEDSILVDRTALVRKNSDGEPELVLDALGRNIQQVSIKLLSCKVLERAQYEQSKEPDPIRFKIAGIITQFQGEYYLLLQRATRAYSHENFGR